MGHHHNPVEQLEHCCCPNLFINLTPFLNKIPRYLNSSTQGKARTASLPLGENLDLGFENPHVDPHCFTLSSNTMSECWCLRERCIPSGIHSKSCGPKAVVFQVDWRQTANPRVYNRRLLPLSLYDAVHTEDTQRGL